MKNLSLTKRWLVWAALICWLGGLGTARAHVAAEQMAEAAGKFLDALDAKQRSLAAFEFKADERLDWHYIPKDRKGIPLKELSAAQKKLALALLASGMSQPGFAKATNIMSLEPVLAELEGSDRRFPRDAELYYVLVFGKPDPKGTWGWRFEGHHLSANFTIVKGEFFAGTPSFFGSNPAEVRKGPRQGLRVLASEEDLARAFVKSLSEEQRKAAVFSATAPKEIFTEAKRRVQPLENLGIAAAKLEPAQQRQLMGIVRDYARRLRPDLAASDLRKIERGGIDKVRFAWAGGLEKGQGHYYRVQGPTFLIEYDNTQNDHNHVHAVWRDFDGDFGEDLLKKHYQESPH